MANSDFKPIRPCVRCNSLEKKISGACKACARAARKIEYKADKERFIAEAQEWRRRNEDRVKFLASQRYLANSDRVKAAANAWNRANPEKLSKSGAAWKAANPEARAIHKQNRRARASGGRLSSGLVKKLLVLQKGRCPCCKETLGQDFHLDHKMPLALGGSNTDENMQLLRRSCNLKKSAKHSIDFMQSKGFLL